jgi:hypothetical protein
MRLPAVVRLSRSFWDDARDGTAAEKRQFVMRQLTVATDRCRITHSSCRAVVCKEKIQRGLQKCWCSAQRWRTFISAAITLALSRKEGFELRGVVKPLALFCRHLALLALCQLFSRQATRIHTQRTILTMMMELSTGVHIHHFPLLKLCSLLFRSRRPWQFLPFPRTCHANWALNFERVCVCIHRERIAHSMYIYVCVYIYIYIIIYITLTV